jgi:hypothetical protein
MALAPVPQKIPIVGPKGFLTEIWAKFFRDLWASAGGLDGPSNADLQEDLESLTTTVSSNTTDINTLRADVDGLLQGPNL